MDTLYIITFLPWLPIVGLGLTRAGERRGCTTVSEHDLRLVLRLAKRVGAPEVRVGVGRMTIVLWSATLQSALLTNLLLRLRRPGARRQRLGLTLNPKKVSISIVR